MNIWKTVYFKAACTMMIIQVSLKELFLKFKVNSRSERYFYGISSLSHLYRHTKFSHYIQPICERCNSFMSKGFWQRFLLKKMSRVLEHY